MKQFYFLLIALCAGATVSNAQFKKGDVLFGPSINIGSTTQSNDYLNNGTVTAGKQSNFSFGIGLSAIKMKTAKVGWGLGLGYGFSNNKTTNLQYYPDSKVTNNNVSLSVFRRQYFPIGAKWNIYYDAGLTGSYGFGKTQYTGASSSNPDSKSNNYFGTVYVAPGISYSIGKKLLLDARLTNLVALTYQNNKTKQEYTTGTLNQSNSSFGFNSTLSSGNFLNSVAFSLMWVL